MYSSLLLQLILVPLGLCLQVALALLLQFLVQFLGLELACLDLVLRVLTTLQLLL